MMDTFEVLTEARSSVERGWIQHTLDFNGHVCAIGAIAQVARRNTTEYKRAGRALARKLPLAYRPLMFLSVDFLIPIYNDRSWRTQDDVLRVYDKAIRKAKRKHDRRVRKEKPVAAELFVAPTFPVHLIVFPEPPKETEREEELVKA